MVAAVGEALTVAGAEAASAEAEVEVEVASAEDLAAAIEAALGAILDLEKCTKLYAQTASRIAKFHLNRQKESQCIARNAILNTRSFNF